MIRRRTEAIVLRRWPYSETSLAVHVLTPAHGVVPLLAKGAQRLASGSLGVLDTWALVDVEYGARDAAEMHTLLRARLSRRFGGLSRDVEHLVAAGVVAELAELAAPPGTDGAAAFGYLLRRLEQLDAGTGVPWFLCGAVLEGLDLLGLRPKLGDPDGPGAGRLWFSPAAGGALPAGAAEPLQRARRLAPATLALLRRLQAAPDETAAPPEATAARIQEVLTILGEFMAYHLERTPRAWAFLRPRRRRAAVR